jgi:hypothetical protein
MRWGDRVNAMGGRTTREETLQCRCCRAGEQDGQDRLGRDDNRKEIRASGPVKNPQIGEVLMV